MSVQFPIKDEIREDYTTGEYYVEPVDKEEKYKEYCEKWTTVMPYQIGCWVTSYAFRNLFDLGKCVNYENGGEWIYSDTDSCYAVGWSDKKIEQYNEICKNKLLANGYGPVDHNGREYWLGVAELDGVYSEFRLIGAKRYCVRDAKTNELKITVAGVPKKAGAKCLNDDIENFRDGFNFDKDADCVTKRLSTYITDMPETIWSDGYHSTYKKGINLRRNGYNLTMTDDYKDLINYFYKPVESLSAQYMNSIRGEF